MLLRVSSSGRSNGDVAASLRLPPALNSPCEHANPCLTCPLFITNADFLPQHEAQLRSTLELIDISTQNGHQRIVEKNEQIAGNLRRIITACHHDETGSATTEAG